MSKKRFNQRSVQFATNEDDTTSQHSYGSKIVNTITPIMAKQFYSIDQDENNQATMVTRIHHASNDQSSNQSVSQTIIQKIGFVSLVGQVEQLQIGSVVSFELHDGTGIVRVKCFNNNKPLNQANNNQLHDPSQSTNYAMDTSMKVDETHEHSLLSRIQPHTYVRIVGKSVISTRAKFHKHRYDFYAFSLTMSYVAFVDV